MIKISKEYKCFCNSGKKFGECCEPIINKYRSSEIDKRISEEVDSNNFDKAFKLSMADFTKYMIYVKSHTEPLMFNQPALASMMIDIDVKALASILNGILYIIHRGNIEYDFIAFLNNAKNLFFCDLWHKKIDFFIVVWLFIHNNNEEKAIKYIEENVNIALVNDVDFLEIICDVYSNKMSIRQRHEFYDKLIVLEATPIRKVQYMGVKALSYFEIGDKEEAKRLFNEIKDICDKNIDKVIDLFEKYTISKSYAMHGKLNGESSYLKRAIEIYSELLISQNLNYNHKSEMYWQIGLAYFDLNEFDNALINYNKSLETKAFTKVEIDKALVLVHLGDYLLAEEVLENLNYEDLILGEKFDYLITFSRLLCFIESERIDFVIDELKKVEFNVGYFNDNAKQAVIQLYEMKNTNKANRSIDKRKEWLKKLSSIFILQPNIFGLGLNINNILDKFLGEEKEKNS